MPLELVGGGCTHGTPRRELLQIKRKGSSLPPRRGSFVTCYGCHNRRPSQLAQPAPGRASDAFAQGRPRPPDRREPRGLGVPFLIDPQLPAMPTSTGRIPAGEFRARDESGTRRTSPPEISRAGESIGQRQCVLPVHVGPRPRGVGGEEERPGQGD